MAIQFHNLLLQDIIKETNDSCTLVLDPKLHPDFKYLPGQYLTIRVVMDGKKLNRAYSLCSSPTIDNYLAVTVKRTPGGKVSNFINDTFQPGVEVPVLPPMGNFRLAADNTAKHLILIGAGSGITPLFSILKTTILDPNGPKVTLFYGNRHEDSIIFSKALTQLEVQYSDRLEVIHVLSQPTIEWKGVKGRITCDWLADNLEAISDCRDTSTEYFICGPSGMMEAAVEAINKLEIPSAQVHLEHFSAPLHQLEEDEIADAAAEAASGESGEQLAMGKYTVKVILDKEEKSFEVSPSESILDAALDNDLDPPYACMIGSCCTCKAKLLSGKVKMDDTEGLTQSEIDDNYILTCQSHPLTPDVVVSYDDY